MGFSIKEYWSGLPCPSPGNLPDPGIESVSLMSPALAAESLPFEPPEWGKLKSREKKRKKEKEEKNAILYFGTFKPLFKVYRYFWVIEHI